MSEDKKWCYGIKEHDFYSDLFSTKEEAILDAKESYKDRSVIEIYLGEAVIDFTPYIFADNVLEAIGNEAYGENEYAEDYLYDVKKEHEQELEDKLNEVLQKWLEKHECYKPNFRSVINIEKVQIWDKAIEEEIENE